MLYWIIPYLVAYNVNDTANWKHGPVHTFVAQVVNSVVMETDAAMNAHLTVLFTCRPTIEESTISCHVLNATMDNREMDENPLERIRMNNAAVYEEIFPIDFHVEFDKNGVKNVTFPKSRRFLCKNMIRLIIDNLNVGFDLSDENFERSGFVDKSINGECPTNLVLMITQRTKNEVLPAKNLDLIIMTSAVPADLSSDRTYVIEKDRKMHKCSKKTPFFFGADETGWMDRKRGYKMDLDIVSSRSTIYLGNNRFNSYSEYSGILQMAIKGEYIKNATRMKMRGKTRVATKLSLISIDQATE